MRRARVAPVLLAVLLSPWGASAQDGIASSCTLPSCRYQIATRALSRGTILTARDIGMAHADGPRIPVSDSTVAPGWITRRAIRQGEPLRPPAVAPAPVIVRGQSVTLSVDATTLRLSLQGIALSSAAVGDRVTVRLGPKRTVQGLVTGPGQVMYSDSLRSR
jgi:flagellar basal body P-ring formation protein FlgA